MTKEFSALANARKKGVSLVKVASVKPCGMADVYNMEVETHHNFAINGGIIVHNCLDASRYGLSRVMKAKNFSFD